VLKYRAFTAKNLVTDQTKLNMQGTWQNWTSTDGPVRNKNM